MSSKVKAKGKASKAKKNGLLVKPKRPMSAYNFFVRSERAKILQESSRSKQTEGDISKNLSFEEIGRIIGERWRNIKVDETAEYKELAKRDYERYKFEIESYHKDEIKLMCQGLNPNGMDIDIKNLDDGATGGQPSKSKLKISFTKEYAASGNDNSDQNCTVAPQSKGNTQFMDLAQQQQTMITYHAAGAAASAPGQLKIMTAVNAPSCEVGHKTLNEAYFQNNSGGPPGPLQSLVSSTAEPLMDDQFLKVLLQHQQSSHSALTHEATMKLLLTHQLSNQKQQQKLAGEMKTMEVRKELLDTMIAKQMLALQGNMSAASTLRLLQQKNTFIDDLNTALAAVNGPRFGLKSGPSAPSPTTSSSQEPEAAATSSAAASANSSLAVANMNQTHNEIAGAVGNVNWNYLASLFGANQLGGVGHQAPVQALQQLLNQQLIQSPSNSAIVGAPQSQAHASTNALQQLLNNQQQLLVQPSSYSMIGAPQAQAYQNDSLSHAYKQLLNQQMNQSSSSMIGTTQASQNQNSLSALSNAYQQLLNQPAIQPPSNINISSTSQAPQNDSIPVRVYQQLLDQMNQSSANANQNRKLG